MINRKIGTIVSVTLCLAFTLASSQTVAQKSKAKAPPDLEINKKSTRIYMGTEDKATKTCKITIQSRVKNIGDLRSGSTKLHFTRTPNKTVIDNFDILELAGGERSIQKDYKGRIDEGDYKFFFDVDAVAGEPQNKRANNSHFVDCPCAGAKRICKNTK